MKDNSHFLRKVPPFDKNILFSPGKTRLNGLDLMSISNRQVRCMHSPTLNFLLQIVMTAGLLVMVYLLIMPVLTGLRAARNSSDSRSVLEIKDGQKGSQHMLVTRVKNMLEDNPGAHIEVVASGKGVQFLLQGSIHKQAIQSLMSQGVIFTACLSSLQQLSGKTTNPLELLPGVRQTDDGRRYAEQLKDEGYIDELA